MHWLTQCRIFLRSKAATKTDSELKQRKENETLSRINKNESGLGIRGRKNAGHRSGCCRSGLRGTLCFDAILGNILLSRRFFGGLRFLNAYRHISPNLGLSIEGVLWAPLALTSFAVKDVQEKAF
jgi:hypothetical protein